MNPTNKSSNTQINPKALQKNGEYMIDRELIISKLNQIITECISFVLQIESDKISSENNFYSLGIDSLKAATIVGELQEKLNIPISIELMFEYSTITELSTHLVENYAIKIDNEILVIQDKVISSELLFGIESEIKSAKESQPIELNQRIRGEL